ncbi:MAG: hypothetical protein L0Y36_08735 [Planctomycetales bacterium]|nr:hypothetical protein [Planctomycetales bacterium]
MACFCSPKEPARTAAPVMMSPLQPKLVDRLYEFCPESLTVRIHWLILPSLGELLGD